VIQFEILAVPHVMDTDVTAEVEHRAASIDNTIEVRQDRVVEAFQAKTEIVLILARKSPVIVADFLSSRRSGLGLTEIVIDAAKLTAPMRESEVTVGVRKKPRDGANTSSQHWRWLLRSGAARRAIAHKAS